MAQNFFDAPGDIIRPSDLRVPRARDLALALEAKSVEHVHLIECKRISESEEVVVFDIDVEVPQVKKNPILPSERISVTFEISDKSVPKTNALRIDFPRVPHLNLHLQELPRNLCLYVDRYEEVKRGWTPARFIRHVRNWLALTARGELHQPDQPLEPVLLDYFGHIVVPEDLLHAGSVPDRLYVIRPPIGAVDKPFLIAQRTNPGDSAAPFVVSVHRCLPQVHGIINMCPATLEHLAAMVLPAGLALLEELRERLKRWHSENQNLEDLQILVLIVFPRIRTQGGTEERIDAWTFWLLESVPTLGSKLGVWQKQDGKLGLLLPTDESKRGQDIGLAVLNTSYQLTAGTAAALNDQQDRQNCRVVAIGLGALGSQVVMNLARSGFGSWTLIDYDLVMPHNLARHALYGPFVGCPKADAVAVAADTIVSGASLFSPLKADVLGTGIVEQSLDDCLEKADLILDMSASVAVARKIAGDFQYGARRVSLFLAPKGHDLVLLSEDKKRLTTLDAIEMQYYRAVLSDDRLIGHLRPRDGQQRYGQTCRDITYVLPQNLVGMHAAIGASALQEVLDQAGGSISIWRCDAARNVHHVEVIPRPVVRHRIGSWTVVTDKGLLEKLHSARETRLPNETGGVLLGSFDMERHLIYIVDSIFSPPDSNEWPTLYVRGCQGLGRAVDEAVEKTNGMLEYIGEWHSHPRRTSTAPSADDLKVFAWLTELMGRDGLPAVMMIVGDPGRLSCFVGGIDRDENCLPEGDGLG